MVATCCAPGCKSEGYFGSGVSLYRFPKDESTRKAWIRNINRRGWQPKKYSVLCSNHFEPHSFLSGCSRLRIRSNAIPTLFDVLPSATDDFKNLDRKRQSAAERRLELSAQKAEADEALESEETVAVKEEEEVKQTKSVPLRDVDEVPPVSDLRKIEFECPQCLRIFHAYFSAYKHIQKFHYDGRKIPKNSPDVIKPVRVELCMKCDKRIRNNDLHYCTEVFDKMDVNIECIGCKQQFRSIQLFDLHVSGLHSDVIDSLFFPLTSDFIAWKDHMEKQLAIKYLILGLCNSKQTYHCTHLPIKDENGVSCLCPSSIVVREYSKGIQVHFYKSHHGHTSTEYTVPERFNKFVITPLLVPPSKQEYDFFDQADDEDIYVQFKKLMDSIVLNAAKVNISTLKILIGKALEMTTVLNSYDEDDSEVSPKTSKCMTDEQISKALETLNNKKIVSPKLKVKTREVINSESTPKIVNTFSLVQNNVETKSKGKQLVVTRKMPARQAKLDTPPPLSPIPTSPIPPPKVPAPPPKVPAPPPKVPIMPPILGGIIAPPNASTFNDSYKDFVDKNCKPLEKTITESDNKGTQTVNTLRLKQAVNTTPKQAIQTENNPPKAVNNVTRTEPELVPRTNVPAKRRRIEVKKKIKTKIGQFKPSISPKAHIQDKEPTKPTTPVTPVTPGKRDFDYEVKEQENDCNILILKI